MSEAGPTPAPKNNNTKLFLIIGGVAVVAVAVCCVSILVFGALAPETGTDTPSDGISESGTTDVPQRDPSKDGSSRSKAAPVGVTVSTNDMAFTVTGLTDPADEIVVESYELNGTPEPGNRYVMVKVSILCQAKEKCDFGLYDLRMVGSEGVLRDYESVSDVPDLLESTEFFNGATISGNVVYQMQEDETDLVLNYSVYFSPEIFLAVE